MYELVGVCLSFIASVINFLGCTAILAFSIFPDVFNTGECDITVFTLKRRNTVLAVGSLTAVDGTP